MPGTDPTLAQIMEHWRECLDYLEERERHGNVNTPNVYSLYSDIINDSAGEYMRAAQAAFDDDRLAAGALLSPEQVQRVMSPHVTEQLRQYGLSMVGTYEERVYRLIEKLETDGKTFNSREVVFATPTFSGQVGSGLIRRLSKDRFNNDLEGCSVEAKRAECIKDQTSGTRKHRELFRFEGATPARDHLKFTGSGWLGDLAAVDCMSSGILGNPSFEQGAGTTDNVTPSSTTIISNWVLSATTSFKIRVENASVFPGVLAYKGYEGISEKTGKLASLEFVANGNVEQIINNETRRQLSQDVPYYVEVAWKRKSSATGNLTLRFGDKETVVAIGSGTNDVWNRLFLPLDTDRWYRQFDVENLSLKLTVDTLAVGTVYVDNVEVHPMVNIDGTYYLVVGGVTPFLIGDKATWTDTENASRARFSYWLWRSLRSVAQGQFQPALQRLGGVWLPTVTGGTENIAD